MDTTLLLILLTGFTSYKGFTSAAFQDRFLFDSVGFTYRKEHHRLITSGFLHASWSHLLTNMLTLYFFGRVIEAKLGPGIYLLLYLTCLAGGNLIAMRLNRPRDTRSLGASGAVCGILFASIFLAPGGSIYIFPLPIPIASWCYALLFMLYEFIGLRNPHSHIGHAAHLGGALIGLLGVTLLDPHIIQQQPLLFSALLLLTLGLLTFHIKYPSYLPAPNFATKAFWKQKTGYKQALKKQQQSQRQEADIDKLLEKISKQGIHALTPRERQQLEQRSKRK